MYTGKKNSFELNVRFELLQKTSCVCSLEKPRAAVRFDFMAGGSGARGGLNEGLVLARLAFFTCVLTYKMTRLSTIGQFFIR